MIDSTCEITGPNGRYVGEVIKIWLDGESKEFVVTVPTMGNGDNEKGD